jgi:hypothetical protein
VIKDVCSPILYKLSSGSLRRVRFSVVAFEIASSVGIRDSKYFFLTANTAKSSTSGIQMNRPGDCEIFARLVAKLLRGLECHCLLIIDLKFKDS